MMFPGKLQDRRTRNQLVVFHGIVSARVLEFQMYSVVSDKIIVGTQHHGIAFLVGMPTGEDRNSLVIAGICENRAILQITQLGMHLERVVGRLRSHGRILAVTEKTERIGPVPCVEGRAENTVFDQTFQCLGNKNTPTEIRVVDIGYALRDVVLRHTDGFVRSPGDLEGFASVLNILGKIGRPVPVKRKSVEIIFTGLGKFISPNQLVLRPTLAVEIAQIWSGNQDGGVCRLHGSGCRLEIINELGHRAADPITDPSVQSVRLIANFPLFDAVFLLDVEVRDQIIFAHFALSLGGARWMIQSPL